MRRKEEEPGRRAGQATGAGIAAEGQDNIRVLPHCFPATTHATIPSGDTSEVVPVLLPPEEYEGERAKTKDNHDLGKPDLNDGGAGKQV